LGFRLDCRMGYLTAYPRSESRKDCHLATQTAIQKVRRLGCLRLESLKATQKDLHSDCQKASRLENRSDLPTGCLPTVNRTGCQMVMPMANRWEMPTVCPLTDFRLGFPTGLLTECLRLENRTGCQMASQMETRKVTHLAFPRLGTRTARQKAYPRLGYRSGCHLENRSGYQMGLSLGCYSARPLDLLQTHERQGCPSTPC